MAIKISWPRILAVAILYIVVSTVVFTLGSMADMGYYTDPSNAQVWSRPMMPAAGPPPIEFLATSMAFSFISGLLFSLVYSVVKGSVPGKGWKNKGLMYGFLIFLIAGIPSTLSLYLLINLPVGLILSWMLQGLIAYLIMGLVAAKLVK
jgi:hypothetical protein